MMQPPPFVNQGLQTMQQAPQQAAPAMPGPAPRLDQVYRSELLKQLGGGGKSSEPPVTDAAGAIAHVARAYTDNKRQKNMQNFLLNNVGNGQDNWMTSVLPGA